jgi:hypothetical protein
MKSLLPVLILGALGVAIYLSVRASRVESVEARTLASLPPSVQHVVARMDWSA